MPDIKACCPDRRWTCEFCGTRVVPEFALDETRAEVERLRTALAEIRTLAGANLTAEIETLGKCISDWDAVYQEAHSALDPSPASTAEQNDAPGSS